MSYKTEKNDSNYSGTYKRSNVDEFIIASKEILNYLRSCLGKVEIAQDEWEPFAVKLRSAFLHEFPASASESETSNKLAEIWTEVFGYSYFYSKSQLENSLTIGNNIYSNDFYMFNCIADQFLIELYHQNRPRDLDLFMEELDSQTAAEINDQTISDIDNQLADTKLDT